MLQAKLMEVEGQLADARADRRENHRERRMAEAVDSMRRLFPGEGLKGVGVCEGKEHTGVKSQGAGACKSRLLPGERQSRGTLLAGLGEVFHPCSLPATDSFHPMISLSVHLLVPKVCMAA